MSVVGVAGAGFMGSGIAQAAAAAGREVLLYEPTQPPLERSLERGREVTRELFSRLDAAAPDAAFLAPLGRKSGRGFYDYTAAGPT